MPVTQVLFESKKTPDGLYKVIRLNILKANTCIGQIPEPLKPVTMQLLSIRFTSELSSLAVRLTANLSSGIGGRRIKSVRHRYELTFVSANLQDRYEVGVVSQMRKISPSQDGTFQEPNRQTTQRPLFARVGAVHTSNGAVIGIVKNPMRSVKT